MKENRGEKLLLLNRKKIKNKVAAASPNRKTANDQ